MKGDKATYVGQFFEEVGHSILGGELTRGGEGDICLWRTQTSVEVKSSGSQSSYGFRLSVPQIEQYEHFVRTGFPFNRSWYLFFAYRNQSLRGVDGKRRSELADHLTPLEINRYLAKSALWCLLIDLSIITAWKETKRHSTKSVMGHPGARTIDLKCKEAHSFLNGGLTQGLEALRFDPAKFAALRGKVKTVVKADVLEEHRLEFPMTAVVPVAEANSLKAILRHRGVYLRNVVP